MALEYMPGFGNDFETESLPGALPQGKQSCKTVTSNAGRG